jgi:CopG family transcriptional regulator, nickel-responsive regulator
MSELTRFSVSLEADLLQAFDRFVKEGAFATRSEAIRQLLRRTLTVEAFEGDDKPVTASLTLVYDHHRPHLVEKLLALQHDHAGQVVASMHVHLDHDRCLEVLVLRGTGVALRELASSLRGLKGVHTGELTLAETAESPTRGNHSLHQSHSHPH